MNGNDRFLNVNDAHLRVTGGNVHASSFNLDQISITTTSTTSSTIDFLNETKAFNARSNIEIGTANLFVDTTTSNVGIRTTSPEYALDVHGPANVSVLTAASNVGILTTSPEYALDVHGTANVGVLTANTIIGSGGTLLLGSHLIPTQHQQFDIGSAEYKIRHLYLSNNSLWIGDDSKISVVDGKMKFLKRDKNIVPSGTEALGGNATDALAHAKISDPDLTNINQMKLEHWLAYTRSLNGGADKDIKDIFTDATSNYEATSASDAFKEHGNDIYSVNKLRLGSAAAADATLDVVGTIKATSDLTVNTDTFHVDATNSRVGVGTTSPQEKFHLYGAPMVQHSTVYDTNNQPGWYKIGEWDPTDITGARLKISFLGGNGYSSELKERGGETILYATCTNNNPQTKANIEGMIHAYGNAVVTQVKFKHLDNSRHKFEIRAYVESYSQMAMKIECTQTDTFTKYFASSTDLGGEDVNISHAIFTHEFGNDGSLLIGTTSPYYSQRFEVSGGNSRFASGIYSRSQGKRYNYNFSTSGNNNHTLTIPINGASARGIMKLKINVVQVAPNSSGASIAELEGYISAYGGTHGITATKAVAVNSLYAEHICSSSTSSSGNLKIYYQPNEGYQQNVDVTFDIELQLGATFAHAGSLSHALSSSNTGVTNPSFNASRHELDGYVAIPMNLSFDGSSWYTVTSGGSHLHTGTWIVKVYIHSAGGNGSGQLYDETYSGLFTWYSGGTNSTASNDIPLHYAGHAPNGEVISMRTARQGASAGTNLLFQIKSNVSWAGTVRATTFHFRRLL